MKKFILLGFILFICLIFLDYTENNNINAKSKTETITINYELKSVFLDDTSKSNTNSQNVEEEATEESDTTYSFLNEGIASWYGSNGIKGIKHTDGYHGKKTASGEIFDTWAFTCAYNNRKLLKEKALLRVTNLENGKSVIVKVNDTGGFNKLGRIIDLSYIAKETIGMGGVAKVKVELVKINKK